LVAYSVLALVVGGLIVFVALRIRKSTVNDVILGFARSMDKTPLYAGSRRPQRVRFPGL
jgi:hypothetical protein